MFNRENIIGILLLVLCGIVALVMIGNIINGEIPTVPSYARVPFTIVGIGAAIVLFWMWISKRFRK